MATAVESMKAPSSASAAPPHGHSGRKGRADGDSSGRTTSSTTLRSTGGRRTSISTPNRTITASQNHLPSDSCPFRHASATGGGDCLVHREVWASGSSQRFPLFPRALVATRIQRRLQRGRRLPRIRRRIDIYNQCAAALRHARTELPDAGRQEQSHRSRARPWSKRLRRPVVRGRSAKPDHDQD